MVGEYVWGECADVCGVCECGVCVCVRESVGYVTMVGMCRVNV